MNVQSDLQLLSEEVFAESGEYIAGGVVSLNRKVNPRIVFKSARGSKLYDLDGKEYIDYHAAFAPFLLGHNHAAVAKYLGIRIAKSEELKDKLQTTIEKEPDFIRIVETDTGERFILQLEFQSVDEEGMIYRMQEYYGLLRRKYQLPVKQFVIYLGKKASRMQTRLAPPEVFEGFTLTSVRDYSYRNLLASDVPEEIILAILSDSEGKKPVEVLKGILSKLKELGGEEITLRKYIRQLAMLARLRNLTRETQKQITDIGLLYDITKDYLYQEGLSKGREEGIEKGLQKGKREFIMKMLKDQTLSAEKIAEFAGVTVEYVQNIAQELKK